MKLIHKFKSPNFNERNSKYIKLIVIHYTAIKGVSNSIKYLCSKKNKVSSHFLISKKGEIYSLVSEKKRAWHAGQSFWSGHKDINSISLGVELDYVPDLRNKQKYTKDLLKSLAFLIKKLSVKYKIHLNNILGHSDISPYRKIDPGLNFPWKFFEEKKIIFSIQKSQKIKKNQKLLQEWFIKNKFKSNKKKILFMLDFVGYDISYAILKNEFYQNLIYAYSSRYQLTKKNIVSDVELHFINIMLTK
jgi:N-acetylmuramoyl-L-alanine amidase